MVVAWREICYGEKYLRAKCFGIGYLHLFATAVDLSSHLVILTVVTNFFSCDVDVKSLHSINWTWMEPFLIIINIGTHGFYPYPQMLTYYDGMTVTNPPRCYPGMLHIYLIDLINILIHIVWMKLVSSYITALHKKDPEPMYTFFSLCVVKIVLQMMYFAYKPFFYTAVFYETYWFVKIIDICVAVFFLLIINSYTKLLRAEKSTPAPVEVDHPPSYIECLMHTQTDNEKPPQITVATEQKIIV